MSCVFLYPGAMARGYKTHKGVVKYCMKWKFVIPKISIFMKKVCILREFHMKFAVKRRSLPYVIYIMLLFMMSVAKKREIGVQVWLFPICITLSYYFVMPPPLKEGGAYCFAHVCLSVRLSVGLPLNLVWLITQEGFAPETSNLLGR